MCLEINSKISEFSEIKNLRIEKKSSKNYGHADIITKLPLENLKLRAAVGDGFAV